jgi:beta-glucosidase
VRLEAKPVAPINLAMSCEGDCKGSLDITSLLINQNLNEWHKVTIDLACFKKAGTDFSKIISPFNLSTDGKVSLSFADINLTPQRIDKATMSCD